MRRPVFALLLLTVTAGCGPAHVPRRGPAPPLQVQWHRAIDWPSAGEEAAALLSGYLQVDTRNPPGNENLGVSYLREALARDGIEASHWELSPGRGSLIARLPGTGEEKPLCLLSHIDVATWDEAGWPEGRGPLSGVVDGDGMLWGRGALDMKGMGAIELLTLSWLHRLRVPLRRDVILLAVADEEVDNRGAKQLVERWSELDCGAVINEGGLGVPGVFFDDQTVWAISVAEKGCLWVRMVAKGEPGHGSTPMPGRAPELLLEALARIRARKPGVRFDPALDELFYEVGNGRTGLARAVLTHPASVHQLLRGRLLGNPATRAMLTDTVNITGFAGARQPNVVPSEVEAVLDCRLLPGTRAEDLLAELRALVADLPGVRFEVISAEEANGSSWDDPVYAALRHHLVAGRTDAVAGPFVSVGFTDSIYLRPLGARAFGIVPFEVSQELASTMHGNGERVPTAELREGLRRLFSAVVDATAAPGGSPPASPLVAPVLPPPPQWTPDRATP
jgi:acetylornithine deacetylase/succinyl-diaminopimelate desuccinylase-like protein